MTPHDSLFHFTFRWPHHARGWLRSVLPAAVAEAVDWDTLTQAPEKVHGQPLRLRVTDIVHQARLRANRARLAFVTDHKSYPDRAVPGQMLDYAVHLRHRWRRRDEDPPTLVVSGVLYHGKTPFRRDWPVHPHLVGLAPDTAGSLPALQPTVLFLLDDLSMATEESIRARGLTPLATLTLLCLRFLRWCSLAEARAAIERWRDLLVLVDRDEAGPPGRDAIAKIGWYLVYVTKVPAEELHASFERILQRPEETIMSTAEKLRREGEARGEARGRLSSRAEVVTNQLTKRFGALPEDIVRRIQAADIARLDQWASRLLDAKTLDEVFAAD